MKTEWMTGNKKAIAIMRVSSLGQRENTSHATQERDIREYCNRNGLELTELIPIVETARKSELRKKYAESFNQALKVGIHHMVFHKFDRECRNLTDNERNEQLVREGKIALHYVSDQKILHKNSPDTDFLMRDYHAVQNKHYSRELSTKVRAATKTKAESGWFPSNHPPLGYINQKLKDHHGREFRRGTIIVPDSDSRRVRLVQREFELRAQRPTKSFAAIRQQIIDEGLILPAEIKGYHIGSIDRRLRSLFYDCRFHWQGVEYQGKHERIIPKEIYWRVQETFGTKNPYRANSDALFSGGWLKCAHPDCGCNIVFDPVPKTIKATGEKKVFRYYHCTNGKQVHASLKGMRVSEDELMGQLGSAVSEISIQENFRDELLAALNEAKQKVRRAIERDIASYRDALKSLEGCEDVVYGNFLNGVLDKEGYHRQIKKVRDERDRFTNLMEHAQLQISDAGLETAQSILQLATNAESLWKRRSPQERREFLGKLLSNQVLDGTTVRYEIVKPLRTLSEMKSDLKWRSLRDSNSR